MAVEIVHDTLSTSAKSVTCPTRANALTGTPEWSAIEVQNLDGSIAEGVRFQSGTAVMDAAETLTLMPGAVERRDWQAAVSMIAASGTPKVQIVGRDD